MDISLLLIAKLTGIKPFEFAKIVKKYMTKLKEKEREEIRLKRLQLYGESVKMGLHTTALEKLYPLEDLHTAGLSRLSFKVNGKRIPTAIVGKPDYLITEIDLKTEQIYELVEPTKPVPNLAPDIAGQSMAEIEYYGLNVWDQPIYRLAQVSVQNNELSTKFSLNKNENFFAYRLGLGSLWGELLQGLVDAEKNTDLLVKDSKDLLPRRVQLLENAKKVAEYKGRMCVGGIHATIAIQCPETDDFLIPIQQRSQKVGGGQGLICTIPEAYHQPLVFPEKEMDFTLTFYRELYEELLSGEEVEKKTRHLRHDWYFKKSKAMRWFQSKDAKYSLILTGFGFNLVSGNYEAALLCIIRDIKFWEKYSHMFETGWEASNDTLPLLSTSDTHSIEKILSRPDWTGSGLYSIARGLKFLKEVESTKVQIPEIEICLE